MAQIPMGNAGRVMPGRVQITPEQSPGMASARALEGLGQAGVQVGVQMAALETRQQDEEMRRQQAAAEEAAKAKDGLQLMTVEDALKAAQEELGAQVLRGEIPKEKASEAWKERAKKILDDGAAGFRPETLPVVQPRLAGAVLRMEGGVRRVVETKDRQDVTAYMKTRLERLSREYATDPQRAETEAMALFDIQGPHSEWNASELATQRQNWKEAAQFTTGYEAVSRGRNSRSALADAEKIIGGLKDIDPQRKAQLMDRAAGYRLHLDQQDEMRAARAARESEARMRKAEAEFNTFQALADKGTILDPAYIDRVSAATAGTPYQAGVKALAQQAKETGGFAAQPVATQRATLDALDAQIASAGRNPQIDKHREKLAGVLRASEEDLKRDPLRAGLERGVIVDLKPLDLSMGVQGLAAQLQDRVQQAARVGQWAGRAVPPLTSDEAAAMGKLLTSVPPEQFGSSVAVLASVVPAKQMQALALAIDHQDRPLALALAAGSDMTTQGRTVAELIRRGAMVAKDKSIKEDKGAEFGLKSQLAKEVGDAVVGPHREQVIDAARFISLAKQAEGQSVSPIEAVRLAIGGDIVEHNGRRVPVPIGMTPDTLAQRLLAYPEKAISAQVPGGYVLLPGGRPMGVPEFLAALPSAQLESVGLGRYVVRAGGSLALNEQRKPIVLDLR